MKKLLILLLVVVMTASSLFSCGLFHKHTFASEWSTDAKGHWRAATCKHTEEKSNAGDHVDGDSNAFCDVCNYKMAKGIWTQNTSSADGELIWSPNKSLTIVAESLDNATEKLQNHFNTHWFKGTDNPLKAQLSAPNPPDDGSTPANQIIVGDHSYAITDIAYELLYKFADIYALEDNGEAAYLIYAEGGSIAIAYSDAFAYNVAINYIIDNLTDREYFAKGIVKSEIFNILDMVNSEREKLRAEGIEALAPILGDKGVDALAGLYRLYDEDLYVWLANLYEPKFYYGDVYYGGGFYYSNSARNYEGYIPDAESTGQALAILDNSGLAAALGATGVWGAPNNGWWGKYDESDNAPRTVDDRTIYVHEYLPDEMWRQLYTYATTLAANGFKHPHWVSVTDSRLSRDTGWLKGIVQMYRKSSAYDPERDGPVPASATLASPAVALSYRLGGLSTAQAVSKVVPAASVEEGLQSTAEWYKYLDNLFAGGSYSAGHYLNSNISKIRNAGRFDDTIRYLEEHQKDNGLWEDEVNYDTVSCLMKVASFWGKSNPMPKAEAAVESLKQIIYMDDEDDLDQIVYVYNPWDAIKTLIGQNEKNPSLVGNIRRSLQRDAADLIKKTSEKLAKFEKPDGGFSYKINSSAHQSQAALVAVEGSYESDMNATSISITTVLIDMLSTIGIDKTKIPALYYEYDSLYFLKLIDGLDAVVKEKLKVKIPTVNTFDDYREDAGERENGVVQFPSEDSRVAMGDTPVDSNGNYKFFESDVVQNPATTEDDKVLYVHTKVYDTNGNGTIDSDGVECSATLFSSIFDITNAALVGNTYELNTDMYIESISNNSQPILQLTFSQSGTKNHSVWLNFYPYVDNKNTKDDTSDDEVFIRIDENFAGADGVKTQRIAERIPVKQWFNLKVEVYKMYDDEGALQVKAKVFIDGIYRGESDSSHYTAANGYSDYAIDIVRFAHWRQNEVEMYLNNVYVAKSDKPYESEEFDDSLFDKEVSAPSRYDFETKVTDGVFAEVYNTYNNDTNRLDPVKQTVIEIGGARPTYTTTENNQTVEKAYEYGVFLSIVNDPSRSGNKVLSVNTKNTNGAKSGTISLDVEKSKGARVHVIEYDLYFQSNEAANNVAFLQLRLLSEEGEAITGLIDLHKNVSRQKGKTEDIYTMKLSSNSQLFDAGKWYKFRVAIDSDECKIYYQFSTDGGKTYYLADRPQALSTSLTIAKIEMMLNTYNVGGTYYLDNINYHVEEEVPNAPYVPAQLASTPNPLTQTTYDFESQAIPTGDYFKVTSRAYVDNALEVYDASSSEYKTVANSIKDASSADLLKSSGSMFYVVKDPAGSANYVLQAVTRAVGSCDGAVDIVGSKINGGGDVYELTFDYYTDYTKWVSENLPLMRVCFWDGSLAPVGDASDSHLNIFSQVTKKSEPNKYYQITDESTTATAKLEGAVKIGGELFDSHKWYRIKIIIAGGQRYTYISANSGKTYTQIGSATAVTVTPASMKVARLVFPAYNNTSRQYIDNITYEIKSNFIKP